MQIGDKKKAGYLGVVAFAAIGFLVFQLVPKAQAQTPSRSAAPAAAVPDAPVPTPTPIPAPAGGKTTVSLTNDPFVVSDRLKRRTLVAPTPSAEAPTAAPGISGDLPPASVTGTPVVETSPTPAPLPAKAPVVKVNPEPVKPEPRAPILVSLLGVVQTGQPVAMLRVGTAERTARVGDEILPGLRIATVSLAGLTFVNRPGVRLAPGEDLSL